MQNAYFSATDREPLSHVAFTGPTASDFSNCEPFDEEKHRHLPSVPGTSVTILPFQKSPLGLLAIREQGGRIVQGASLATAAAAKGRQEGTRPLDPAASPPPSFDLSRSTVKFFASYPLYVPVYLSKVHITNLPQQDSEEPLPPRDVTVALVGHNASQDFSFWTSKAFIYDPEVFSTGIGYSGWHQCKRLSGLLMVVHSVARSAKAHDTHRHTNTLANSKRKQHFHQRTLF